MIPDSGLNYSLQLERAFASYRSGQKAVPNTFSSINYASVVADYMVNIEKLSERRWEKILGKTKKPSEGNSTYSLSVNRRRLFFTPSSPAKATDDE
jgi:hypothetical protein